MNYDDQIPADQLLRRIVYGRPAPLLMHRQPLNGAFYGRLLDALSNQHAVLVREHRTRSAADRTLRELRKELPAELYECVAVAAPERGDTVIVMVYNRVYWDYVPPQKDERGDGWIHVKEAGRILNLTADRARKLAFELGLEVQRRGGRAEVMVRQTDIVVMANRTQRWKRRKAKEE